MITPIVIAKEAVNLTVATVITTGMANFITDHTDHEQDEISVRIASGMTGWYVATTFREQTDAMVEKAAAWINEKKIQRQTTK